MTVDTEERLPNHTASHRRRQQTSQKLRLRNC